MIKDKTTNTLISVDQGAFGTMTTGYIKELVFFSDKIFCQFVPNTVLQLQRQN
jgi:hypothetical protein